jgi:hypothetical protein
MKKISENDEIEPYECGHRKEKLMFYFSDDEKEEFILGLSDIFECLVFAIQKGELKKLPFSWLFDTELETGFDFPYDISYDDTCAQCGKKYVECFCKRSSFNEKNQIQLR